MGDNTHSFPSMLQVLSLILCVSLAVVILRRRNRSLRLPPGPPPLPLLGNILDIPTVLPWEVYHKWAKQYDSGLISLTAAGLAIVVLDDIATVSELLGQRSAVYSSRPPVPLMTEIGGWDWTFGMMPYGERWRMGRQLMHQSFNHKAANQFRPHQLTSTRMMLKDICSTPEHFADHLCLMVSRVIISSIYGLDVTSKDDPYIVMADKAVSPLQDPALVGQSLFNIIPFLKHIPSWLPGAGTKRFAEAWGKDTRRFRDVIMSDAIDSISSGHGRESFLTDQIKLTTNDEAEAAKHGVIRDVAATIYGGAFETTVSQLQTFLLVMALRPDIQRRAQKELDDLIAQTGSLPSFEDENALPCVMSIMLETLRWHPVAPLGVPRCNETEDEYLGYRIPAKTIILTNTWAIMRDEAVYPEPESFNPDRFLDEEGHLNSSIQDPRNIVFGFGRRICPGRYFAEASLWITMASLLAVFDISEPVDERGRPMDLTTAKFTSGMISRPESFQCRFKPRSEKLKGMIDA